MMSLTEFKVIQNVSASSNNNSNMLLTHWCFIIDNITVLCIIIYQSEGQNQYFNLILLTAFAPFTPDKPRDAALASTVPSDQIN